MEKKKLAIRYLVKNNIHAIAHLIGNRSVINHSIKLIVQFFLCCKQQKSFGKHVGMWVLLSFSAFATQHIALQTL